MVFRCFSSSDPRAVNATKLYDDKIQKGHVWMRGGQNIPLPLCSSISPEDGSCLVCLEQKVYAVCRNLKAGVTLVMERDGHNVEISESECPKLPSDGQLSAGVIAAIVIVFIFIFIIIAGVVGYKYRKRSQTQNELNEFNMQTIRPDGTTQVLMEEGGENNIKHDD